MLHLSPFWFCTNTIPGGLCTALDAAAPVLRAMLGKEMRLRTIPELHFCFDESEVKARRMDELLDMVAERDAKMKAEREEIC